MTSLDLTGCSSDDESKNCTPWTVVPGKLGREMRPGPCCTHAQSPNWVGDDHTRTEVGLTDVQGDVRPLVVNKIGRAGKRKPMSLTCSMITNRSRKLFPAKSVC